MEFLMVMAIIGCIFGLIGWSCDHNWPMTCLMVGGICGFITLWIYLYSLPYEPEVENYISDQIDIKTKLIKFEKPMNITMTNKTRWWSIVNNITYTVKDVEK